MLVYHIGAPGSDARLRQDHGPLIERLRAMRMTLPQPPDLVERMEREALAAGLPATGLGSVADALRLSAVGLCECCLAAPKDPDVAFPNELSRYCARCQAGLCPFCE